MVEAVIRLRRTSFAVKGARHDGVETPVAPEKHFSTTLHMYYTHGGGRNLSV